MANLQQFPIILRDFPLPLDPESIYNFFNLAPLVTVLYISPSKGSPTSGIVCNDFTNSSILSPAFIQVFSIKFSYLF